MLYEYVYYWYYFIYLYLIVGYLYEEKYLVGSNSINHW